MTESDSTPLDTWKALTQQLLVEGVSDVALIDEIDLMAYKRLKVFQVEEEVERIPVTLSITYTRPAFPIDASEYE